MKTLTAFAFLALLTMNGAGNALSLGVEESIQNRGYYMGGNMGGDMCARPSCETPCQPACPSRENCCATYHKKCYIDACCNRREVCCRDIKGIFNW